MPIPSDLHASAPVSVGSIDLTPIDLTPIDLELDEISREWLEENHPGLAVAIERAVETGATPVQIRRRVYHQTQRIELARRCEQAARRLRSD